MIFFEITCPKNESTSKHFHAKYVMNLRQKLVLLSGAKRSEKDPVLPMRKSGSATRVAQLGVKIDREALNLSLCETILKIKLTVQPVHHC